MKYKAVIKRLLESEHRQKYMITALLFGILMMLIPTNHSETSCRESLTESMDTVTLEERRLEELLSAIDGVGACRVLLSVYDTEEQIGSVEHSSENNSIYRKSGAYTEDYAVVFQGALIVAEGCNDHAVRYDILSSVMAYTGLSVDKVIICQMQS